MDFQGHWPVGSAGLVVANDEEEALRLAHLQSCEPHLAGNLDTLTLEQVDLSYAHAIMQHDGDY